MTERMVTLESAQSSLRAVCANALAQAFVLGVDNAAQEGRPLSQRQQIDVCVMTVMAYSEAVEGVAALEVDIVVDEIAEKARARIERAAYERPLRPWVSGPEGS